MERQEVTCVGAEFSVLPCVQASPMRSGARNVRESPLAHFPFTLRFGARRACRLSTPLFKLLFGLFFSNAVLLLELAQEFILFARYYVKIIVRELTPPLLHRTFELIPSTLYLVPVHIHLVAVHALRHGFVEIRCPQLVEIELQSSSHNKTVRSSGTHASTSWTRSSRN